MKKFIGLFLVCIIFLSCSINTFAIAEGTYTIQHKSNGRYLDAHETSSKDYGVVTRPKQNNDTQKWFIMNDAERSNVYRILQISSLRYLDAYHNKPGKDFKVVTRPEQDNNTQKWIITKLYYNNSYRIEALGTRKFMDAYVQSSKDYRAVTRRFQSNKTQEWILKKVD